MHTSSIRKRLRLQRTTASTFSLAIEALEPRFVLDSTVVFNEVMYNPSGTGEELEWIELHNQLALDMDLTKWSLRGGVEFEFPADTVVPADGYLVVASDPAALAAATGFIEAIGPYTGALSNGGEFVELRNNSRRVMDVIDYRDGGQWPVGPDGSGATLAKIDEQWSAAFPGNWRTSEQLGGTPGQQNFPTPDLTPTTTQTIDLLADWRYEESGIDQGADWREPSFDDSAWATGPALFHAGAETVVQPELGLRFLPITGDADSGVNPQTVYTHALDFGASDVAKVNGVSFRGVAVPDLPSLADFDYDVSSGIKITSTATAAPNVAGDIADLLSDYITDFFNVAGGTATLTVSGLTVGAHYDTRLYTRSIEPGTRNVMIEFDTNGIAGAEASTSLNQNDATANPPGFADAQHVYAISYDFVADNTELVITITQEASNKAFNLFGLTNQVVGRADLPVPIETLFSTGLDSDRGLLPPGSADPHWFVTDTEEPVLAMSPNPAWTANSATSQWSGIVPSGTTNVSPGQYSFSTQFDLTGYDDSTAVISMLIGVDDSLQSVVLNGINTGISTSGFGSLQGPFVVTDGFLPGNNTLEFIFVNGGAAPNPSGLHVQFDAKAIQFRNNTEVAEGPPTHYFRHTFDYDGDLTAEHTVELNALLDDGAVFYLNGQEVFRQNMPAGPISYSTPAAENISIPTQSGRMEIPADALVVGGPNVLAVEVHQASPGNSDVLFGAELLITETPVAPDALPSLRINEISSARNDSFWLELRNDDRQSIDVGDYVIRSVGSTEAEFAIPNQLLAPGDYLVVTEADLGIAPQDGDRLFLQLENPPTVVDARKVTNRLRGRSPQHNGRWLYPNLASPGTDNAFEFQSDIVINEIRYHPPPVFARPAIVNPTTVLSMNGPWRYNPTGVDLGPDWHTTSHAVDGANWLSGNGPLGVERSVLQIPLATEFDPYDSQVVTYYFEQDFTFDRVDGDFQVALEHLIDDGAVFYLNGAEVLRFNMAEGSFDAATLASGNVNNARLSGPIFIPDDKLVIGTNRLSAEVHQRVRGSSDIVFGAELTVQEIIEPAVAFAEPDDTWIELYNRGASPIDLTNWRFTDGINYTFEPGTVIQPREYLVVARDVDAFQQEHPNVRVVGEFSGRLSRFGERIELTDLHGNPADEVHYYEAGRWPVVADGGGSTLELRDPNADNAQGEAWSGSIESNDSVWEMIRYRGSAVEPPGSNNPNVWQEFVFGLLDAGDVLVDDISVIEDPDGAARERIQNGSFDAGTETWRLMGNHGQHGLSEVIPDPDDPSNNVLHLVATGATEHMSNHVETTFADGASIVNGGVYEISLRVRWLSGSPQLHTRLYFNRMARTTILPVPERFGTPGESNSVLVPNIGPTYEDFHHLPAVPQPGQPVPVSVRPHDPDGLAGLTLWYSVDEGPFRDIAMTASFDGTYRGTVPGQDASSIVQFYVEGQDVLGVTSMFPAAGPDSRALYKVDDSAATAGPHHQFRLIMTESDTEFQFREEHRLTNHRLGATVVFDETQVYYDVGARLKGSGFSRGSAATGYNLRFHPDNLLFGVHDVVAIDRQGGPWGIGASHRELTLKHIGNRAGDIAMMYDDAIQFLAPNPSHNGTAQLLAARYDNVFLDSQFENGSDGTRYKFELVYYSTLTQNGDPEGIKRPPAAFPAGIFPVLGVDIRDLGDDPNSYRWNFLIRNRRSQDDFSRIIALGKALSLSGSTVGGALDLATQEVMDVDQWMRNFAFESLVGINDTYNQGLQHNLQFYVRPSDSRVLAFPWDMDFSFHHSTSMSIYGTGSNLRKVINIPTNRRIFQGHLHDIISTTYNVDYLTPWVDHIATRAVQDNSTEILNYVAARRNFVLSQLLPELDFEITTNGGNDIEVADSTVTLAGNGWINVREIRLAGNSAPLAVSWLDDTSWQLTLPLAIGANPITLEAYDFQGELIGAVSITVTSTIPNPIADGLRISELNYHPHDPTAEELRVFPALDDDDFEFVELTNIGSTAINLANTRFIDGIEFTFPAMELAPGQFVVAVRNAEAFRLRYGDGPLIAGQYDGALSNGGERLTVIDGVLGATVLDFEYQDNDPWSELADGNGASLRLIDVNATPTEQYGKHYRWRFSSEYGGSPGIADQEPTGVVINEVLARTGLSPDQSDAIELHNPTAATIDIGGWFLSDAAGEPLKYRIPDGTLLQPGVFLVFDELDFNPNPVSPGPTDFALSGTQGDDVIVTIGDGLGGVAQFVDEVHFGASRLGESLGRIPNGLGRLAANSRVTLGCGNSHARVGPLVVSEIQYAPGDPSLAALEIYPSLTTFDLQYIEIHNPTLKTVDLTDWRVRGGVDFEWDFGATIGSGETAVIVSFNPDSAANADRLRAFREHYAIDEQTALIGGFSQQLDPSNDRIVLQRPDDPPLGNPTMIPRLTEDEVLYDDLPPWPTDASGSGSSLQRRAPVFFGNMGTSWTAGAANPGSVDFSGNPAGDLNGDQTVDAADMDVLFDALRRESEVTYYDLNGSNTVDPEDVRFLVENVLGALPGDANLDGSVDAADFNIWRNHRFQACNKSWADGEFSGDSVVDVSDFNIWLDHRFNAVAAALAAIDPSRKRGIRLPRAPLSELSPPPDVVPVNQLMANDLDRRADATLSHSISPPMDGAPTGGAMMLTQLHSMNRRANSQLEDISAGDTTDNESIAGLFDEIFARWGLFGQ